VAAGEGPFIEDATSGTDRGFSGGKMQVSGKVWGSITQC
jgi:hypothetical protein